MTCAGLVNNGFLEERSKKGRLLALLRGNIKVAFPAELLRAVAEAAEAAGEQ